MKYIKFFEEHQNNYVEVSDIITRKELFKDYYEKLEEKSSIESFDTIKNVCLIKFNNKLPIFENIHIFWTGEHYGEDVLAMYVHSTSLNSNPFIILFEDAINAELIGLDDYEREIEMEYIISESIYHELGHAIVDIDNYYIFDTKTNILTFQDEEDYVEDFCRNFYDRELIPNDIIKLMKLFKEKSWIGIEDEYEINQ